MNNECCLASQLLDNKNVRMNSKMLLVLVVLFASSIICHAQVEYLRLSPAQKIEQRVGMTDMILEFSRPQMNDRKVFGALVPYGKFWRTGANENTTLAFDHRIKIGETEVEDGKYALITKPMKSEWEIYLYTDINNLDVPNPIDSTKLIYLTTVPVLERVDVAEALVINFYNLTETTADLGIDWERTGVRIPISFFTREAMEKKIEVEFKQNVFDYSIAASYYYQRGIELDKAKELKELAMSLKETLNAWDYHSYGAILHKMGNKKEALKNIELSLKLAQETQNNYLITECQKLLEELKGK